MITNGAHIRQGRVIRVGPHYLCAVGGALLLCEGLILWLALSQGTSFPLGALILVAAFCSPLVIWALRMRVEVNEHALFYVPGLGPGKLVRFQDLAYSSANVLALNVFIGNKHSPFLSIRLIPLSRKDRTWLLQLPQLKVQK